MGRDKGEGDVRAEIGFRGEETREAERGGGAVEQ